MINIILPRANTSLKPMKRILFVLRSWQSGSVSESRRPIIEYRANSHSFGYMLALALEFKAQYASSAAADIFVESETLVPLKEAPFFQNIFTKLDELTDYDTIVFLYPDAIGLGWGTLERGLSHLKAPQCLVINGRRRIFIWDATSRKALGWRRFLYRFWFVDGLIALWVIALSSWFAFIDTIKITRKNRN